MLVNTSVLEEHSASIFKVDVGRMKMQLGYMGSLPGRWSLMSMGGGEETEPDLGP
jgi:hypothetical protein